MRLPEQYMTLLDELLCSSHVEKNIRTGVIIKMIPATMLRMDLSDDMLPTIGVRLTSPRMAAVEMTWFLGGDKSIDYLNRYKCHFWDKFANPDGIVKAAYGHRMRRHFGFDQLQVAKVALERNPTDRQVMVQLWDPREDMFISTLNKPCPTHFQLTTFNQHLNMNVYMRSSDVFVGLPYDIMGFAMLMKMFALELNMRMGYLTFFLGHPHLYEVHWEMAAAALKSVVMEPSLLMPLRSLTIATNYPGDYVKYWENLVKDNKESFPKYNPMPEVVR